MIETKKITGKKLAELMEVNPAVISISSKNSSGCKGKPIGDWAVRGYNGKLLYYDVPVSEFKQLSDFSNEVDNTESVDSQNESEPINEPGSISGIMDVPDKKEIKQDEDVSGNESDSSFSTKDIWEIGGAIAGIAALWYGMNYFSQPQNNIPNKKPASGLGTSVSDAFHNMQN